MHEMLSSLLDKDSTVGSGDKEKKIYSLNANTHSSTLDIDHYSPDSLDPLNGNFWDKSPSVIIGSGGLSHSLRAGSRALPPAASVPSGSFGMSRGWCDLRVVFRIKILHKVPAKMISVCR